MRTPGPPGQETAGTGTATGAVPWVKSAGRHGCCRLRPAFPGPPGPGAVGGTGTGPSAYVTLGGVRGRRSAARGYGNLVTLEGMVSEPEVGEPVLLTTWAYCPLPPSEITSRSCSLIPEPVGTWKPWAWTIEGSDVKLQ